jgi:FMN phosphatase YigB (HAD superfamily)
MGIWANTRRVRERGVREWLKRAGINHHFAWVITSVDAGCRKPNREFFDYALRKSGLEKESVLFVGNQLNTDIKGALEYGLKHVWLSGKLYRSADETMTAREMQPMYIIPSLWELPDLLDKLR